ncbi:MAG: LLM class flavin-dependent oxidoreductase, partial [Deltaproteobacteria bacterium]|nr:LLM class flavin-dependent oxidoreductase [Deltaproteobacteria bacterium]
MRIGLLNEGSHPPSQRVEDRWAEVMREALIAEEVGFDFWGVGEQHFTTVDVTFACPEVIHAWVGARTERIRLRPMAVNFLPYNHPVRIAEQIATLD